MAKVKFKGVEIVAKNLAIEINKIEGRTQAGVTTAAQWVRRKSVKLVPVIEGNLRNSVFVNWPRKGSFVSPKFKGKQAGKMSGQHTSELSSSSGRLGTDRTKPSAEIGYSAVYALKVHENPDAGKTGKVGASTVGQYKFLEFPFISGRKRIARIIIERARVRK